MKRRFIPLLLLLLTACGSAAEPTPAPTLDPVLARGQSAFQLHCAACHSLAANTDLVGPSLAGIAARAATRVDGLDARSYLYTSIMRPGDYLVGGFQNLMPSTLAKSLSGEDIDAIVAYLLAQH